MKSTARRGRRISLPGHGRRGEPEWPVLLTLAAALTLGLLVQLAATSRTEALTADGISVNVPPGWIATREEGAVIAARDLSEGDLGVRLSVYAVGRAELAPASEAGIDVVSDAWSLRLGILHPEALQLVRQYPDRAAGREARTIEYAYLTRSRDGRPVLMRASDTLVAGVELVYVLTFATPSERFAQATEPQFPLFRSLRADVVGSWRIQ